MVTGVLAVAIAAPLQVVVVQRDVQAAIVAHEQARERALAAFKAMPGPASAMSGDDPA